MRKHLAELALFVKNGKAGRSLEEFDSESERLIAELLGETSGLLDAYQYAQLGEAAGLVNMSLRLSSSGPACVGCGEVGSGRGRPYGGRTAGEYRTS